jgi:hypothetical protein
VGARGVKEGWVQEGGKRGGCKRGERGVGDGCKRGRKGGCTLYKVRHCIQGARYTASSVACATAGTFTWNVCPGCTPAGMGTCRVTPLCCIWSSWPGITPGGHATACRGERKVGRMSIKSNEARAMSREHCCMLQGWVGDE